MSCSARTFASLLQEATCQATLFPPQTKRSMARLGLPILCVSQALCSLLSTSISKREEESVLFPPYQDSLHSTSYSTPHLPNPSSFARRTPNPSLKPNSIFRTSTITQRIKQARVSSPHGTNRASPAIRPSESLVHSERRMSP
jgi:hypothetical protein